MSAYSLSNEAFVALMKYGGLLLVKLMAMSPITSLFRLSSNSYCSDEDAAFLVGKDEEKKKRLLIQSPSVQRVS